MPQAEERTPIRAGAFGQKVKEEITVGTSEWEGWGTALKPAHEPIVLARKSLSENSIVANVLKHKLVAYILMRVEMNLIDLQILYTMD